MNHNLNEFEVVSNTVLHFSVCQGDLGESDINVEHLCWGTGGSPTVADGDDATDRDSIVGKVIGMDDDELSTDAQTKDNKSKAGMDSTVMDEDSQEPLALLVVHAAMHMLFLPQFTCDFYEEDPDDDYTTLDSSTLASKGTRGTKRGMRSEVDDEADMSPEEIAKKRREEEKQAKEDNAMRAEAGLGITKFVDSGVVLLPKPASIVWAAGCGVTPNQVSPSNFILHEFVFN